MATIDLSNGFSAPSSTAVNSSWTSAVQPAAGFSGLAVGVTLSQKGVLAAQRYVDVRGTTPNGPATTAALAAGAPGARARRG
ncbi:MAG: hypothetical protein JO288_21475 [Hyphomicrobiales bacterium]|nr:hypothetical protein [Hyphomicrobiales bacterium]